MEYEPPHHYHSWRKRNYTRTIHFELANLKIPKANIKTLVKNIHQNAIKYLTYLVLNKRKLENNKLLFHLPKKGIKTN